MRNIFHLSIVVTICLLPFLFGSCNLNRYIPEDKFLLKKNTIDLPKSKNYEKAKLLLELTTLYKEKQNSSLLLNEWLFFKKEEQAKTQQKPNRLQRYFNKKARKPNYQNDTLAARTAQTMNFYLQNKGFLYPEVTFEKKVKGKQTQVTYKVNAGTLYVIDSISLVSDDPEIQLYLNDLSENTLLKRNSPLDSKTYDQEKLRIVDALNNLGYAKLTPNYITPLEADTTIESGVSVFNDKQQRKVNITLRLLSPTDQVRHQRFSVGEVNIYPNYNPAQPDENTLDTLVDNKHLFTANGNTVIRPRLLSESIKFEKDSLFNKTNFDRTYRSLNNLGIYKFITIKPLADNRDSNIVNYNIFLTPQQRMNLEGGAELNYSNISNSIIANTNQSRFGLALDLGFGHRNLLRGAERLNLNLSAGVDVGFSYDTRAELNYSVPKFRTVAGFFRLYDRIRLINKSFFRDLKENGNTDINAAFNYTNRKNSNRQDFFSLQSFDLAYRYNLRKNSQERYSVIPTGVNLSLPTVTELFDTAVLQKNPFLKRSLDTNQLATGLLFRNFTYELGKNNELEGKKFNFLANLEQSGGEVTALALLFNKGQAFKTNNLLLTKYIRLELDARKSYTYANRNSLAYRLSAGIAVPFGNKDAVVPFLRQFFVGGPNSIRAWRARGIGAGGYFDSLAINSNVQYLTGDIKLEGSAEWRFPLFWRLQSAIFLDAGNVWTLRSASADRTLGNISTRFYEQIAIGTGFSLRLDVTYTLIRFDFGLKVKNPYLNPETGNYWTYQQLREIRLRDLNVNFALGLPF